MRMRQSDLPFANDSMPDSSREWHLDRRFELPHDFLVESPVKKERMIQKFNVSSSTRQSMIAVIPRPLTFFNLSKAAFSFFSHFFADLRVERKDR